MHGNIIRKRSAPADCGTLHRSKRKTEDIDEHHELADEIDVQGDSEKKEQIALLNKHLVTLSREQQEIVFLRVWDELPFKEIAIIIGKGEAACKMTFYRAVLSLGKMFLSVVQFFVLLSLPS